MQTIKLYAGMTNECEVISTNAPISLLEQQLIINNIQQELSSIINPYELLNSKGYIVNIICSSEDSIDLDTIEIDKELDYYDYNVDAISFNDLLFDNEQIEIELLDIKEITVDNGNILIENIDGLFYQTESITVTKQYH